MWEKTLSIVVHFNFLGSLWMLPPPVNFSPRTELEAEYRTLTQYIFKCFACLRGILCEDFVLLFVCSWIWFDEHRAKMLHINFSYASVHRRWDECLWVGVGLWVCIVVCVCVCQAIRIIVRAMCWLFVSERTRIWYARVAEPLLECSPKNAIRLGQDEGLLLE